MPKTHIALCIDQQKADLFAKIRAKASKDECRLVSARDILEPAIDAYIAQNPLETPENGLSVDLNGEGEA